ncbi:MAG: arabinofuranosidase catalytic domain-containing protein [Polyangiaceae bacterium]
MSRQVPVTAIVFCLAACGGHLTVGEQPGAAGAATGDGSTAGDTGAAAGAVGSSGGSTASGGSAASTAGATQTSSGSTGIVGEVPCDALSNAGHLCVSAHSTVRQLVSTYLGNLYQVRRSDGQTAEIRFVDGYADAEVQREFCAIGGCTISIIYDQSGQGNDLVPAPPGGAKPSPEQPANAALLPVTVHGHSVYGVLIKPGIGYRKLVGNGTATGDAPQTIYMVTSQKDTVKGCCFNYGNAETSARDDGSGSVEALNFSNGVVWGTGSGPGPWVMADLQNGLFAGWEDKQDARISTNTTLAHDFITAVLVGDTADKNGGKGRFALYGGDATSGTLTSLYDGIRPEKPGYVPMHKQGSVILGIAGDNSASGGGRFYEGVIANGAATAATLEVMQANIVAAGYAQ